MAIFCTTSEVLLAMSCCVVVIYGFKVSLHCVVDAKHSAVSPRERSHPTPRRGDAPAGRQIAGGGQGRRL